MLQVSFRRQSAGILNSFSFRLSACFPVLFCSFPVCIPALIFRQCVDYALSSCPYCVFTASNPAFTAFQLPGE